MLIEGETERGLRTSWSLRKPLIIFFPCESSDVTCQGGTLEKWSYGDCAKDQTNWHWGWPGSEEIWATRSQELFHSTAQADTSSCEIVARPIKQSESKQDDYNMSMSCIPPSCSEGDSLIKTTLPIVVQEEVNPDTDLRIQPPIEV